MPKKEFTTAATILLYIFSVVDLLPRPFESKTGYYRRMLSSRIAYRSYMTALNSLEKRGFIKIFKETSGERFIKLTQAGQLETLMIKAKLAGSHPKRWDGKWRMVIFDIPEDAKEQRNVLRDLLKKHDFFKLQHSVYINPYPLNREAVSYLKESGLIKFIRILKVEEMDYDKDLKKHFKI